MQGSDGESVFPAQVSSNRLITFNMIGSTGGCQVSAQSTRTGLAQLLFDSNSPFKTFIAPEREYVRVSNVKYARNAHKLRCSSAPPACAEYSSWVGKGSLTGFNSHKWKRQTRIRPGSLSYNCQSSELLTCVKLSTLTPVRFETAHGVAVLEGKSSLIVLGIKHLHMFRHCVL